MNWKQLFNADIVRNGGTEWGGAIYHFQKTLRKAYCCKSKLLLLYYKWRLKKYRLKYGLEIPPETQIGPGLYLGHPFNITVNGHAVIGSNCNLHKGIVIGRTNRGKRKGTPVIGNRVWIGINAAIVGGIKIGDDVLIAPNSYVNQDVPSHSVVFGNPCIIKPRENATEGYINNIIDEK